MTDKTPAMTELPEPELGYIETDKSRQPAFSARQMREALQSAQPAAAVSDEAIYAVWTQHCQTPGTTTRQLVCGFARAILALRPQALAGEREAFEAWFDDYYDKACAEFGGIDCTDPKGIAEDAWQARASLPTQPAAQATPQADPLNPGWCVGCNPDNCMGCGIGLNKAQATPDQFADASKMVAPVALRSVHLTRDTAGMCVVRINGRVAIRDNGDLIDHTATLEWFADTQQATPEPVGEVPIWNSIQIASWIGSQLMHEPAMFERAAVCKFVRSLGRHPTLLKHSPKDHVPAPGVPEGWTVSAYKAAGLTIQSMAQLKGPDLWKIADAAGNVLNKQGEWEWEPMPSSRDDAFLARCRYATLAEASAALAAAQAKGADK